MPQTNDRAPQSPVPWCAGLSYDEAKEPEAWLIDFTRMGGQSWSCRVGRFDRFDSGSTAPPGPTQATPSPSSHPLLHGPVALTHPLIEGR